MTVLLTPEQRTEIAEGLSAFDVIGMAEANKLVTPDGNVVLDDWAYRSLINALRRLAPLADDREAIAERLEGFIRRLGDDFDSVDEVSKVENELRALVTAIRGEK